MNGMKRFIPLFVILAFAVLLAGVAAHAQTVIQSGPWTPGDVPVYAPGGGSSVPLIVDGGMPPPVTYPPVTVTAAPYLADPTGLTDSTRAFNAALATGACVYAPAGTYLLTNAITFPRTNWCLFGDGETKSVLLANSATFNLAALGVVVIPNNGGGNGGVAHDFGISFSQPDTSSRGSLVAFPPGIYMQGVARPILYNIQISQAITCIDGRGNMGGAFFTSINCGALSYGLRMDGSLDGNHIVGWHEWDFGINLLTGLTSIYFDGTNTCLELGRIDGIVFTSTQCFSANIHWTANAVNSVDAHFFNGLMIDSSGIIQDAAGGTGNWINNVNNAGNSSTATALQAVVVNSGNLNITNCRFGSNSTSLYPTVQVTGGNLVLNGCSLATGSTGVQAATIASGGLSIYNSVIVGKAGMTVPLIEQTSGSLKFEGNNINAPPSGGAGIGVKYDSDANQYSVNYFRGNSMAGWALSLPATVYGGYFEGFLFSAAGTPVHACGSAISGLTATVSDATAPSIGGTYTSGGSVVANIRCNGTNWVVF
jgi:hypothetical protein